ncbi:hypothetical protein [Listeria booriae]|uniref:hypothetical protein n=1 Tax=Listeria booriae TaxID=1552123 RepID=UPI00162AEE30|nr:hypothetical protein [Listeria booriae]MBC2324688.1 hypothetical protein [Listeria booriae]MCD2208347.1 hypothetical protein [Listeria booriae]
MSNIRGLADLVYRVGWVQTACGTDGCTTPVFIFDVVWMVGMFLGRWFLRLLGCMFGGFG